jgi:hypothetical protein
MADRETTIADIEFEREWKTLGFSCRDAWMTWRLAALDIPAVVENGRVRVAKGTLKVDRLPEQAATRYSWTP